MDNPFSALLSPNEDQSEHNIVNDINICVNEQHLQQKTDQKSVQNSDQNSDLNSDQKSDQKSDLKSDLKSDQKSDNKLHFENKWTQRELQINELLVSVFRFVVNKKHLKTTNEGNNGFTKMVCISLIDENESQNMANLLTTENVDQYLCERLMLPNVKECLFDVYVQNQVSNQEFSLNDCETRVLHYLYECYHRIETIDSPFITTQQKINLRNVVINQSSLILCHPEFDPNYDESEKQCQLLDLLDDYDSYMNHKSYLQSFVVRTVDTIVHKCDSGDEEITLTNVLKGSYDVLRQRLSRMSLIDPTLSRTLKLINYFVMNANLSKCFIELNEPKTVQNIAIMTNEFQNTLIGLILSISCLPRPNNNQFEFFLNPSHYSQQEHNVTEKNLGIQLNLVTRESYSIMYSLLKQHETRNLTLNWIEKCLYSFRDRAKMWTNEMLMMAGSAQNSSDGFMINLSAVLLQLCKPFCIPPSSKLLKVDARYCRLKKLGNESYLEAISSDPFLTSCDSEEISDDKFELNFMTQAFVATHKALHLGFRVVHERFFKLVQDLNQIQNLYNEANLQSSNQNPDALQLIRQRMDKNMTQFLALKTMLSETEFMETMLHFHNATAIWLNNLAINSNESESSKAFKPILLPIPRQFESKCLKSVPEFIVENISDFIIFVKHFSDKTFALPNINLEPLMTMIIIFMGSPERMKNPHLRAKLAEMLEALMPSMHNEPNRFLLSSSTEKLFTEHPSVNELIPTLVHVFVSIEISETSGESVAFEQKFGYRRPMYIVLKYLWNNELHRKRMKELADYAENNMESMSPPLFLRFINLLMNDAIFLLDEALTYMNKIRELQIQRDSGEWAQLTPHQRQQNEANFHHTGRLAKVHNIIGRETINTLSWLTEHIKTIFSHKTLVDRMASMLNYFLIHLVGPKKRNFKVKDLSEYEFKPANIVHDICKIYLNLCSQENKKFKSFCLAVGRDDRSYSSELLPLASEVLIKTGYALIASETIEVAQLIEQLIQQQRRREILPDEVPEEFLDPIMSSLMNDPVILPNSGVKVDRSTIARHLLSDQTDPFTRSPLTMDMIRPDIELKQRIRAFIEEKIKSKEEQS